MQPTPEQIKQLTKMNLAYRFHDRAATYDEDPKVPGRLVVVSKPYTICDIFDRTTGILFHSANAQTEAEAFEKALAGALTAEKPLTPAQMADPFYGKAKELAKLADERAAEIETLKAKIAELEGNAATTPPAETPPADPPPARQPRSVRRNAAPTADATPS